MRKFRVCFIDEGNCDIWDCEVECNGFSEAIGQALEWAGIQSQTNGAVIDVLTDLSIVNVEEVK